ncbi:MAG: hypothetical protein C0432_05025 [Candidatus Puniceispirillum sp.]|nr:hypothetical protein [Candidatus Pelagibacter sp.]MBA4283637.1 hypothetical protein [Candidatus Puniceispirillum sp.]
MFKKIHYRTLQIVVFILSQLVVNTYSLDIDPNKEILSRDKKPIEKSHHSNSSKLAKKENAEAPSPKFLGDLPQKLPKLDDISEDGTIESKIEDDNKSKTIHPKIIPSTNRPKEGITTKIKTFLGITGDAKKGDDASKDKVAKKEATIPKKKEKSASTKNKQKENNKTEISPDSIEGIEEQKTVEKVDLSSYMKYFDRMETFKTLFNLHDFNIDQDSSLVEPSSYLKLMFSIQNYISVILNTDHYNEISHIITTKSTEKTDFEKIFIVGQYIKMIVKLTHQNLKISDFLYKPTLLRFPQLSQNSKQIQTSSKFISSKDFLYLNEKFDLYIKKNTQRKVQIDKKIIKKIKNTFTTSSSSMYIHDNLGLITYVLFVPYTSHDSTIKYFIFLNAVEMDDKQKIKSVYDIYLVPHNSYAFSIDKIHDHIMLQNLSDSLQKDLLKTTSTPTLDPMFKKIIKNEENLTDEGIQRNRNNREAEDLRTEDIEAVDHQRQRQVVAPKKPKNSTPESYKKEPEPF